MSGADKKQGKDPRLAGDSGKSAVKTDGSLGGAKFERLKRPVNADAFLVDRPLSPEEESLAGPLPDKGEQPQKPERK